MTFAEIRLNAQKLLPSLAAKLPSADKYLFLNKKKFESFILRLKKLSHEEQRILVLCIEAATNLIVAKHENDEEPDYRVISHIVVNNRINKDEERKEFTSLVATFFAMKSAIKKGEEDATEYYYEKEVGQWSFFNPRLVSHA